MSLIVVCLIVRSNSSHIVDEGCSTRAQRASQHENAPKMMSPIATRASSQGPPGVAASERSAESSPLACCGCVVTAATTRNTPTVANTTPANAADPAEPSDDQPDRCPH